MGQRKRIKQLIKDDRPKKLKSFLVSHNIDPYTVRFSGGRNALHYCAENGSTDMLRCLLRLDCDATNQDKDGQLPLHVALYRCLHGDINTAQEVYEGMCSDLLKAYPLSRDMEDRMGNTCLDIMKKVELRLKPRLQRTSAKEEKEWQQKLASESYFEFEEQEPIHDFLRGYSDVEEMESFSDWSHRLRKEYYERHHTPKTPAYSRKRTKEDLSEDKSDKKQKLDPEEELRKKREEMAKNFKPLPKESVKQEQFVQKKCRFEKKFIFFFSHPPARNSVTFGGIPWPCVNIEQVTKVLLSDVEGYNNDNPEFRKCLKKEQVRWHPDKFLQKFREFLHPEHVDKIMGRVKQISQILNSISAT